MNNTQTQSGRNDLVGDMLGGVIIVGSLYWQADGTTYNNDSGRTNVPNLRQDWRNNLLNMSNAVPVRFPIAYGRTSKPGEGSTEPIVTMTISPDYDLGRAYLVPFNKPLNLRRDRQAQTDEEDQIVELAFDNLIEQARQLARAEGMIKIRNGQRLATKWGIISAMFNLDKRIYNWDRNFFSPDESRFMSSRKKSVLVKLQEKVKKSWLVPGETIAAKEFDSNGNRNYWWASGSNRMIDPNGFLTVFPNNRWLMVDNIEMSKYSPRPYEINQQQKIAWQEQLNELDVVICTITVPDEPLPSLDDVARSIANDRSRRYFVNNYENGIRTSKDGELLRAATRKIEYMEVNPGIYIRSGSHFPLQDRIVNICSGIDRQLKFQAPELRLAEWESTNGYRSWEPTRIVASWSATDDNSVIRYKGKSVITGNILCFQQNGNLVIYDTKEEIWNLDDETERTRRFIYENEVWSTGTNGNAGDLSRTLRFCTNGILEIWAGEKLLWSSAKKS